MVLKIVCFCLILMSSMGFSKTITLTDQNAMILNGPVDGESMTELMVKLQKLNEIETSEPIYLVLNSPGGSVYDGFDFIRFAQTSKRKIDTVTIFAASMAFQLVETLGTRYVTSYSTLMSHLARGSFGNAEMPGQLDSRYSHFLSHLQEQDKIVVARTKGKHTLESYHNLIQKEYWANSDRAITDGFADEQVIVNCDKTLKGSSYREISVMGGLLTLEVEFSNCPLIVSPLSVKIKSGLEYATENKIDINKEFNNKFNTLKNINY